jgi:hypothetical protein
MMRYILTILTFGLCYICSYGQTLTDIEKRLRLIDNRVELKYDTTGFSALPKPEYFCAQGNKNKWDAYHVIDLNKDGLNDLIYCGPCKPYNQVGIFLNNGTKLRRVYDSPGDIIFIDNTLDRTIIHIFGEACCCNNYAGLSEVTIDNNSTVTENTITYFGETKITLSEKLKEITVTGTLRTSPEVDDSMRKDDCSDELIQGNHLAQITNRQKVIQLRQAGQWRLVLYAVDKKKSQIGWVRVNQ